MEEQIKQEINNTLPIKLERDENGLYKHIQYLFDQITGLVNWRAMIPKECLYINEQSKKKLEEQYNKKIEEIDIINDKVEDKYLIINLAGIRQLAFLRGFTDVNFEIKVATENYAATKCSIKFLPNYETLNQEVIHSDVSCCHFNNCRNFAQNYLLEISANRSFCRAVRSFLRLSIVSSEELGKDTNYNESSEQKTDIYQTFQNALDRKGKTLQDVINRLEKEEYPGAKDIKTIKDIPEDKIFGLIEKLNKVKDKS